MEVFIEAHGGMDNSLRYFAELRAPRVEGRSEPLLEAILVIMIAALLSGANIWNEIEGQWKAKQQWLGSCFLGCVRSIAQMTAGEVVAIDGKSLRGTRGSVKKTLVPMVSA